MIFKKSSNREKTFLAGDKTLLKEILHPNNDGLSLPYSIAQAYIRAGQASVPHTLSGSEVYYIMSGEGMIYINGESTSIQKGDVIYVPPNEEQYVRNTGTEILEFLCIVHPFWTPESEVVT